LGQLDPHLQHRCRTRRNLPINLPEPIYAATITYKRLTRGLRLTRVEVRGNSPGAVARLNLALLRFCREAQ
jgi:hypothetical protein